MPVAFRPCGPEALEWLVALVRHWHASAPGADRVTADAAIPDPRFRADLVLEPGARRGSAVRMARSFAWDLARLFGGSLNLAPMAAPSAAPIEYHSRARGEEAA